jgi:hypothetical protein
MLPGVILGPFVATLVDRWNRRWIMVLADDLVALATLVMNIEDRRRGAADLTVGTAIDAYERGTR